MHTKATILLTVLIIGAGGCAGSDSSDNGEGSTLATLGVELRDPAVRAEWEATCAALAGDAAVADTDASIAPPSDDDDDADEVAEESADGGDHDRTRKICDHLAGGPGRWHGRGHGRGGHHDAARPIAATKALAGGAEHRKVR